MGKLVRGVAGGADFSALEFISSCFQLQFPFVVLSPPDLFFAFFGPLAQSRGPILA
jgi:hypothetical protein